MYRGKFRKGRLAFFQQQIISGQSLLLDEFHFRVPEMPDTRLTSEKVESFALLIEVVFSEPLSPITMYQGRT